MHFLKVFLWTSLSIGLGVFLSTVRFDGKTSLEHLESAWHQRVHPALEPMKDKVHEAYDDAKDALSLGDKKPREHHSAEDREAVNRLVAKRTPGH